MISVSGKKWKQREVNENLVEKIKQDLNLSEVISRILITRNFDQTELNTLNDNLSLNNIFFKNVDFKKSIELVINSINNREYICILGDYDVDGSAATSLFIRFLETIKHPYFYYIPDREKDGYGATKKLFKKLILKKPQLIIMLDCGSTSNDAVNYLNENKIKSLIIDHHEISKPFPKANSIINPKKDNGYLEYDYLCATALTYFFLDLLSQKMQSKIKISNLLIYVLLATVCDVMPLRKLNRQIAITALKDFDINKNIAFNELFILYKKKNKITVDDLAYLIGPILNSGGRLGKSSFASELLSSDELKVVKTKSKELIKLNNKRKEIERLTLDEIDFKKIEKENSDIIVYYNPNINEGLIGIIAARLKEYFNKPSIVITNSGKDLKGSARSIYNYNIGRVIKNSLDKKIILNGGGHNMAAGFTLNKINLNDFKDFILKDFLKKMPTKNFSFFYDTEISSQAINQDFFEDLKKLEPFGTGNPNPIFLIKHLRVIRSKILKNNHLSVILKSKSGRTINSILFNSTNTNLVKHLQNYKKTFNVMAKINENIWNNKKALQLYIQDLVI
jgi:single-stranded-DNA-specific exonuclease